MADLMEDRRCRARSKRSGQRCKRAAIVGGTVCSMHGGNTPAVRAAAERRAMVAEVTADAEAILAHEAVEPIDDPILVLGELAAEVRAMVKALGARVNALRDLSYTSVIGTEQARTELTLLGQYQDRLARILTSLSKFNLDERRVQLTEAQALVIFGVLDTFIQRLQLPPERQLEARAIMAGVLHEVDREAP